VGNILQRGQAPMYIMGNSREPTSVDTINRTISLSFKRHVLSHSFTATIAEWRDTDMTIPNTSYHGNERFNLPTKEEVSEYLKLLKRTCSIEAMKNMERSHLKDYLY